MTYKKLVSLEKELIKLKREGDLNLVDRNSIIEVQKIIDSLLRDKEAFMDKFGVMNK